MISIYQNIINIYVKIRDLISIDDKGAFVLPLELRLKDQEFIKYCHLDVDWDVDSISNEDLPSEFSLKAVKLVDLFRRKTVNLPYECILFFDYKTGEIIYCFVEENLDGKINGKIYENHFEGHNIASIHNHPKGFLSAPSGKNFQILQIKNEDYELICGYNEFWILEAKGVFNAHDVEEIKNEAKKYFFNIQGLGDEVANVIYGDLLLNYINNKNKNIIKLKKVRYH